MKKYRQTELVRWQPKRAFDLICLIVVVRHYLFTQADIVGEYFGNMINKISVPK